MILMGRLLSMLPIVAGPFVDHGNGAKYGCDDIRLKLRLYRIIPRIHFSAYADDVLGLQVVQRQCHHIRTAPFALADSLASHVFIQSAVHQFFHEIFWHDPGFHHAFLLFRLLARYPSCILGMMAEKEPFLFCIKENAWRILAIFPSCLFYHNFQTM
jgi:hypothetical protein